MTKAIISCYFDRFVVCEAKPLTRRIFEGVDHTHRGYNFLGKDLGYREEPKYTEQVCYTEGDALSKTYNTLNEAIAFAKANSLEIVFQRQWS